MLWQAGLIPIFKPTPQAAPAKEGRFRQARGRSKSATPAATAAPQ